MQFKRADIQAQLTPSTGAPGSPARIVVDYRDWLRAMQMVHPGLDPARFNLELDFSGSGGAQGPSTVPMGASGIIKVTIARGKIAGSFPLGLKIVPRSQDKR